MPEVLLTSDDLTVLGGPATVNVQVDFGQTGDRGSQIYVNLGKPVITFVDGEYVTVLAPNSQIMDLYINIATYDDEYQYVYQLQNVLGALQWVKLFKLFSNIYSENVTGTRGTFDTDGILTIDTELTKIVPAELIGSLTAANFNVQYNILGSSPISSASAIPDIVTVDGVQKLRVVINAIKYDTDTWVKLVGENTVHLLITVV
jgi:hypothetical protein